MKTENTQEKLNILLLYENKERAEEIHQLLLRRLTGENLHQSTVVHIQDSRNKVAAAMAIKRLEPVIVVVQMKMWNNPKAGLELLEYCLSSVAQEMSFYSIIHGASIDEEKKQLSSAYFEKDSFHLGTCSLDIRLDDLLVEKIIGIINQNEDNIIFEHIETTITRTAKELYSRILNTLLPLKNAFQLFQTGHGDCFKGTEKLLLNLHYEIKKLRMYYNELFNLEVQRMKFGRLEDKAVVKKTEIPIHKVFSDINIFLTDSRSPLIRLANWMKSVEPGVKEYYQILQYLESRIGDYQVYGFSKVFLDRFADFEENLSIIDDYLSENV